MGEIVQGLGTTERKRIADLRSGGRFFWIDISLGDTTREELGAALGIPGAVYRAPG